MVPKEKPARRKERKSEAKGKDIAAPNYDDKPHKAGEYDGGNHRGTAPCPSPSGPIRPLGA